MQVRADVEAGGQPTEVGEEVLGVEDAHDLVDGLVEDGHARVEVLAQEGQDVRGRGGEVQTEHVRPRHHDLAHQPVLELEDLVDHLALGAVHDALAGPHVDEGAQLLLGDLRLPLLPLRPDHAQGERGQPAEEDTKGPHEDGEPPHGAIDPRGIALRVLHGQGHGQHLAEDDEKHGHGADGDGQAHGAEHLGRDGGGKGGRRDLHEGRPHEKRDEKVVGALEQRLERAVPRAALFGQPLEPRPSQGEVGGLRTRQQRGDEEERDQAQQLERAHAMHGSARSPPAWRPDVRPRPRRRPPP